MRTTSQIKFTLAAPVRICVYPGGLNACIDGLRKGLRTACVAVCWNRALDADTLDALDVKYDNTVQTLDGFASGAIPGLGIDAKLSVRFKKKIIR